MTWLALAAVANVLVPQLEQVVGSQQPALLPAGAASEIAAQRAAAAFSQSPTDDIGYLVLERQGPLTGGDKTFYQQLIAALRADERHVLDVEDFWGNPQVSESALSEDRNLAIAVVVPAGKIGSSQADESIKEIRDLVAEMQPPDGLDVYLTGPGATVADEFDAISGEVFAVVVGTAAVLFVLLLLVYRSVITSLVPLLTVGVALAVARPAVALLAENHLIVVSAVSIILGAGLVLGAGIDFGIFLIGRYHESRTQKVPPSEALVQAYRGVAPVIVGSALTVATALACLNFARIPLFRSAGLPCSIGILTAMAAALTLTPALIALLSRANMLEPRARTGGSNRWRRTGVVVTRWPVRTLVVSGSLVIALTIPLLGMKMGWHEPGSTPGNAESNAGYQAADRHFADNELLPDIVTIEADHDLRNPAGLIAVERITRAIMELPNVRTVRSASRPTGNVPPEATLTAQAGDVGNQLDDALRQVASRQGNFDDLDTALGRISPALGGFRSDMQQTATGLDQVDSGAARMREAMTKLQSAADDAAKGVAPLRGFTSQMPDCAANPLCADIQGVVQSVDTAVDSSAQLVDSAGQLEQGSAASRDGVADVPNVIDGVSGQLQEARSAMGSLQDVMGDLGSPMQKLSGYLHGLAAAFAGSPDGGYYVPQEEFAEPRMRAVLKAYVSPNGKATHLFVYSKGQEWGNDGARRTGAIRAAVDQATKEGTLKPTAVELAGVGPVTRDMQGLVRKDDILLIVTVLLVVFLILFALLKTPVGAGVIICTVTVSFAAALGASALIWQHLLGHDLHWAVPPIAFGALVAVGSDYNLLLAMRIREEHSTGLRVSIIRAFAATGGLVTTAGLVFAITMFVLGTSSVLVVAQVGTTIGVGLLLDTLVVRSFILPSLMVVLGRWFWWSGSPFKGKLRSLLPIAGFGRRKQVSPKTEPEDKTEPENQRLVEAGSGRPGLYDTGTHTA